MLEQFNALVDGLPPAMIYLIIAALVFAEAALFVGFVFPGETAIVVGGVLASQHVLSLPLLLVVAVVAAVAGDSVGYEIGRRYGPRLLDVNMMRRHRGKVAAAQDLIRRRGAFAVFIGRFTALLRALMPALAGSSRLPYPKFLLFNVIGGVTWVVTFTLGGFFAGTAFEHAAKLAGRGLAIGLAVAAVVALVVWSVRKHRREGREEAEAQAADHVSAQEGESAPTLPS
ncbi:DedA family protein [Actinomadura mexicana]|uniref:Membrane protein DedA, SNARE-associated domain n=1 Tax=Actinomadura mexicana TaxID=134959 RepID=A0A239BBG4_9ACTN|nr:DedA family protein [Actinomadura mexicana]SNS05286.1 membrane protein DedA, SNARE-associated domain [Actinomadura mexicana]